MEANRLVEARPLGLVLLGGAIGTAGRERLHLLLPAEGGIPWSVFLVNIVGAALLGALLAHLAAVEPETPRRREVRLFVGTGILGGFTTYSALATDTVLLAGSRLGLAMTYAVASVVLGVLAAGIGFRIGRLRADRRADRRADPARGGRA